MKGVAALLQPLDCGATEGLKQCTRYHTARFCSSACMRLSWRAHKQCCTRWAEQGGEDESQHPHSRSRFKREIAARGACAVRAECATFETSPFSLASGSFANETCKDRLEPAEDL
ncbi:hypothetical protein T492DRAFT_861687 [Pavlovales sp. CCMP2436]|nr:hypothetical protein T492DRAFT_861687 [Pavlovales sp. CCMP2436]